MNSVTSEDDLVTDVTDESDHSTLGRNKRVWDSDPDPEPQHRGQAGLQGRTCGHGARSDPGTCSQGKSQNSGPLKPNLPLFKLTERGVQSLLLQLLEPHNTLTCAQACFLQQTSS